MALNRLVNTVISAPPCCACCSVSPTEAIGGWVKTNAFGPANDATPLDQFNPGIGQQRSVNGFKPVQFAVLGVDQRRPVMTIHTQLPAVTAGIFNLG